MRMPGRNQDRGNKQAGKRGQVGQAHVRIIMQAKVGYGAAWLALLPGLGSRLWGCEPARGLKVQRQLCSCP